MSTATMTLGEAREALGEGRRLRVTIGSAPDDPVVVLSLSDGMVMCESVAGWSAGVVEQACFIESDYLGTYLDKSIEVLEPGDSGWRAGL
jgi:hypothetical protein